MIVAKYKFNPDTYSDYLPVFNSGFSYTKSDVSNSDGTITRTIESDSLPTSMKFGENPATNRSKSLLEILDMNTSNLTNMSDMFRNCENLTSIICNWNTSKVTTMNSMFSGCKKLISLDVSNFDTSKVANISYMFLGCNSLTSLDVSNFNTSLVKDMYSMFSGCSSLTSLDISNWDTSQVNNMSNMFSGCSSLTSLDISNWNTSKVINMGVMFQNCSSLTSLDVSNWNTSNVTNMQSMFNGCSKLTSLDVSNWNTSNVTTMNTMFGGCSSLTSLDVSNWNTSKVTNMNSMFQNCSKLTSLDLSKWDTSRLTQMGAMFFNCVSLITLNLSNWNTINLVNMSNILQNCSLLTSLDISNWDTSQVNNIVNPFYDCRNLRKVNLKYANQFTVSKIHENLPNRTTTKGYILASVDLTSNKNWQIIKSSHNKFYLPQPLRKIGDIKDRLYWDENKGHYCIEQNIKSLTYKYEPSHNIAEYVINDYNYIIHIQLPIEIDYTLRDGFNWMYSAYGICDKAYSTPIGNPQIYDIQPIVSAHMSTIWTNRNGILFTIPKDKLTSLTVDGAREFLSNFGEFTIYYVLHNDYVKIIDLPYLNQKLTFDSYTPSTTIDIPNRPLKASKTYLDAPIARYRYTNLQPSTQYNVQFDCKGDSGVKVNLGGTEVTFTPTSEWTRKNLTITTPSELVNDKLSISNVGITSNNKIDNVMLFSEVIAQEPYYIDGIQSIGELQDDGTYKIDIRTKYDNRESTHSIYLPIPLRKIGNVKDKFYWDYDKGHYCIEQNISKAYVDISIYSPYDIIVDENNGYIKFNINKNILPNENHYKTDYDRVAPISNTLLGCSRFTHPDIKVNSFSIVSTIVFKLQLKYLESYDAEGIAQWFVDNPTYIEYVCYPQIIDLPEMNQKFSFDTYLPNTYVDVTNLPLQPYKLQLEDDTVRYKSTIEPSTLYTIQFNCVSKLTTRLTLDLGGSRVTVDPIIGVNHVQITTPSELTSDRLFLIGTGIVVKEVIVNKGNMNQYTKYFDGEQSVGELQENGTYIIRISTDNYTNLWEGDL